VLDKRPGRRGRSDYFLVKWEGYPEEESTWEPAAHLADAQESIAEFESTPLLPRRSARLRPPAAASAQPSSAGRPDRSL